MCFSHRCLLDIERIIPTGGMEWEGVEWLIPGGGFPGHDCGNGGGDEVWEVDGLLWC